MKIIAYYLPQFYRTETNDKWWGPGFTEWTNVTKAKKLFRNHYQPKIPKDLGFYDLRRHETHVEQAAMAKEAGVYGFCYYHYWFGNGIRELEKPFEVVLNSKELDFPFCLCWANHSWYAKTWHQDGSSEIKGLIVEQKYLGEEDDTKHFYSLIKAFEDPRYIKHEGKLVFVIYDTLSHPNIKEFIQLWNKLAKTNDLPGFYFVGYSNDADREYNSIKEKGIDAINSNRQTEIFKQMARVRLIFKKGYSKLFKIPLRINYKDVVKYFYSDLESKEDVFPTVVPNWDHTPRSGTDGYLFTNSTPEIFEKTLDSIKGKLSKKGADARILFLRAWNEWGEGNYIEPDLKYGSEFLQAIKRVVKGKTKAQ